jgi:hypothetical protein
LAEHALQENRNSFETCPKEGQDACGIPYKLAQDKSGIP